MTRLSPTELDDIVQSRGDLPRTKVCRLLDTIDALKSELAEETKLHRWCMESLTAFRDKFGVPSNCQALDAIDALQAQLAPLPCGHRQCDLKMCLPNPSGNFCEACNREALLVQEAVAKALK